MSLILWLNIIDCWALYSLITFFLAKLFFLLESIIAPFFICLILYESMINSYPLSSDRREFPLGSNTSPNLEISFFLALAILLLQSGVATLLYNCHPGISLLHHTGNNLYLFPVESSLFWIWCFPFPWFTLSFWTKYAWEVNQVPTGSIWPTQRGQLKRV